VTASPIFGVSTFLEAGFECTVLACLGEVGVTGVIGDFSLGALWPLAWLFKLGLGVGLVDVGAAALPLGGLST
jgi:hypothetical protein